MIFPPFPWFSLIIILDQKSGVPDPKPCGLGVYLFPKHRSLQGCVSLRPAHYTNCFILKHHRSIRLEVLSLTPVVLKCSGSCAQVLWNAWSYNKIKRNFKRRGKDWLTSFTHLWGRSALCDPVPLPAPHPLLGQMNPLRTIHWPAVRPSRLHCNTPPPRWSACSSAEYFLLAARMAAADAADLPAAGSAS